MREAIIPHSEKEGTLGDSLAIFPALCRPDEEGVFDDGIYTTGLAMGVGFAWTVTDCYHHTGNRVPFEDDCKSLHDGLPLRLKPLLGERRPDIQATFDSMAADMTGEAHASTDEEWHFAPRPCAGCLKSAVHHEVGHELRIGTDGPSHFFAYTAFGSGGRVQNSIEPSLEVNVFGSVYRLYAVVYHRPQSKKDCSHFVVQVYFPERKCWLTCDSLSARGKASCRAEYDTNFFRGQEYIFLYVKNPVVNQNDVVDVEDSSSCSDGHLGDRRVTRTEQREVRVWMLLDVRLETNEAYVFPEILNACAVPTDHSYNGNHVLSH